MASNDSNANVVTPFSGSYDIQYTAKFELDSNLGADIPLRDIHLSYQHQKYEVTGRHIRTGTYYTAQREYGEPYDQDKEDLWLFRLHVARKPRITFTIGAQRYVIKDSEWKFDLEIHNHQLEYNWDGSRSDASYGDETYNDRNRYVAIRAPKMDNPAITVQAEGGEYCALYWIGLFVQRGGTEKAEFIAVRTTCELNPVYADRHKDQSWWSWTEGVDVIGRPITVYPKQLYGSGGLSRTLYDLHVATFDNPVSKAHASFDTSTKGDKYLKAYMWFSNRKTILHTTASLPFGGTWSIEYATGLQNTLNDGKGLQILLAVFTTIASVAIHLATGQYGSVIGDVLTAIDKATQQEFEADVDRKGFITTIVDTINKKGDEAKEKIKGLNTKNVAEMKDQTTFTEHDFGDTHL